MSKLIGILSRQLSSPLLPAIVILALLAISCSTEPEDEETSGLDNGLAFRVTELPVEDGVNKLIDKYDYNPEATIISNSVPTSTQVTAEPKETYIPPAERWVYIKTSQGDIKIVVHSDWAPHAAKRFIELVEESFYDGAPFFVVNDIIAQTGIAAKPEVNELHEGETIPVDPMHGSNTRGTIAFVQALNDPASRNTQIYFNLQDNPQLDGNEQGEGYYVPFAEVMEGMDVLEKLHKTQTPRPGFIEQLASDGVMVFRRQYPQGDTIEQAILMN